MAYCSKCKSSDKCKCTCTDTALSVPASFSNDPTVCPPNSEQCTELFDMACICYNGADIVELDIQQGDRLDEVLIKLVSAITNPSCATFSDPTACQTPINVTFTGITASTFVVSWDQVAAATGYTIEFKEATATSWTSTVVITAPTVTGTIIGLNADTVYDVRILAICPSDTCYSLNYRIKTLES